MPPLTRPYFIHYQDANFHFQAAIPYQPFVETVFMLFPILLLSLSHTITFS